MKGSAITLSDIDSPAFVGRRQSDLDCKVSTRLDFNPQYENEEAGLALRGNDQNHFEIGITRHDGKRQVFLKKVRSGKLAEEVRYEPVGTGEIVLTIKGTPSAYEFFYQAADGVSRSLGTALTRDLSSETIGGFTGVYVGVYATGNGKESTVAADFDWFDYIPKS